MGPVKTGGGGQKLLIIDDDPRVRRLLREALEGNSYITIEAENGIEGLDLARQEHPDLVLLDVVMPRLDGYEVCRWLKLDPATARARVVLMSGGDPRVVMEKGRAVGADRHLPKPCSLTFLPRLVAELLAN